MCECGCMHRLSLWLSGKESVCHEGDTGDAVSIPGLGRSPGGGNGNPLQYSCLETPMDRGAWWATVRGVTESDMPEATEHACMHVYNARTDLYVVLCVCLCMRIYVCADLCVVVCVCVCVCGSMCGLMCVWIYV